MDTLQAMRAFVRATELGTLSAAAREAGIGQPTLSKWVAGLERQLGVRLFERSTTTLALTEQGRRFYQHATRVLEEYGEAVADARGLTEKPQGLLRVNSALAVGELRLNGLVHEFMAQYPDIEVELILNDRYVDLVEEGMDVALRLGTTLPPHAVARRIAHSPRYLVAAPAYLQGRPAIRAPTDLAACRQVRFAWLGSGDTIELGRLDGAGAAQAVQVPSRYRVNSALAVRESIMLGAGLGLVPAWLVHDMVADGRLLRVLPDWQAAPQQAHLLYPSRRYQPLRARLFIDFVARRLPTLPGFAAA
ncbi:LysR family transcriptional regulator [Bordetella petrii]|uniref:LysR family transcriptional regulator n=1 Tax=Bordetella petrii TaxID=94624 RepID=UPI001A95E954|nr:LysR family transcriptional regulator [Bordetella petrii]MBO1114836.1 LysR family transcriptional regulator [Bordetella petrii]